MDLPHELLSKFQSLSSWRLLEANFGWRVTLQRRLLGSQAWCMCVCRQVFRREGEESSDYLPWKQLVHLHIPVCPLPSSSMKASRGSEPGGPWACRRRSNPMDCGGSGVAWVLLVVVPTAWMCTWGVHVREVQGLMFLSCFFPFLFLHTASVLA